MDIKKSKKANLESRRVLFFEIALIVVLSFVYFGFQWSTENVKLPDYKEIISIIEDDIALPDMKVETKLPKPKKEVVIIDVVDDDDLSIDEDEEIDFSQEIDIDEEIEIVEMDQEQDEDVVYQNVSKMPEYHGGISKLYSFISSKLNYPSVAAESGIQGTVYVKFVVSKTGKVSKVQILRGVDPSLNREAIRVIRLLPRFIPGEQRAKKVNVWFRIPVKFRLS